MKNGFTLIEVLIVLAIIASIFSFSIIGGQKFKDSLEYGGSVDQILSDVKLTRQLAETSSQACRIDFNVGNNIYAISRGNAVYRSCSAGRRIKFSGKSYFAFLPSGQTAFGGSGTLLIGGAPNAKKIVVSQRGRIRVE